MTTNFERIRALVALAVDKPDTEEARTAAVRACIEIHKSGILGETTTVPNFDAINLRDPAAVEAFLRAEREREQREEELYGPHIRRVRRSRRVFCHKCKTIIEAHEESVQVSRAGVTGFQYECLHCFDGIQAPAIVAKEAR